MVCTRCIMAVRQEFEKSGLFPTEVIMGEVELQKELSTIQREQVSKQLEKLGFEILDHQKQQQIEQVKMLLISKVQSERVEEHFSLHDFFTKKINSNYPQLSRLFSEVEGITIEQFFILQKIEKVKEWLAYEEQTLSEISWKLGYSSVAHLSAQFKKVTGLTPSNFKKPGHKNRKSLDQL